MQRIPYDLPKKGSYVHVFLKKEAVEGIERIMVGPKLPKIFRKERRLSRSQVIVTIVTNYLEANRFIKKGGASKKLPKK